MLQVFLGFKLKKILFEKGVVVAVSLFKLQKIGVLISPTYMYMVLLDAQSE